MLYFSEMAINITDSRLLLILVFVTVNRLTIVHHYSIIFLIQVLSLSTLRSTTITWNHHWSLHRSVQCDEMWCDVMRCDEMWWDEMRWDEKCSSFMWCGMVQICVVRCGLVGCSIVWYDMVWVWDGLLNGRNKNNVALDITAHRYSNNRIALPSISYLTLSSLVMSHFRCW
jgi:hypothetical protein